MEKKSSSISEELATESFSYSWLIQKPPPPDYSSVEDDEEMNFEFKFDVATSPAAADLVNADEIFSHGQIMPYMRSTTTTSVYPSTILLTTSFIGKWKKFLHKWLGFVKTTKAACSGKISTRVDDLDCRKKLVFEENRSVNYVECFDILRRDRCLKIHDKINWRRRSSSSSSCSSPDVTTTPFRPSNYGCCDIADQNSIREAILYCKRSIEK
ncbi:hypothetical protein C2S51_025835 [Perilla frutescens var. frutescens]|nr:hypothetical protein C2S51_025835 [Perilla frutescens var. frutescens]